MLAQQEKMIYIAKGVARGRKIITWTDCRREESLRCVSVLLLCLLVSPPYESYNSFPAFGGAEDVYYPRHQTSGGGGAQMGGRKGVEMKLWITGWILYGEEEESHLLWQKEREKSKELRQSAALPRWRAFALLCFRKQWHECTAHCLPEEQRRRRWREHSNKQSMKWKWNETAWGGD